MSTKISAGGIEGEDDQSDPNDVSVEDVSAYIKGKKDMPEEAVELPIDPGVATSVTGFTRSDEGQTEGQTGETAAPDINLPVPSYAQEPVPASFADMSFKPKSMPDIKITVTDEEKDAYFMAVLNNERFHTVVPVLGGKAEVKVRGLTTDEMSLIMRTADYEEYLLRIAAKQDDSSPESVRVGDSVRLSLYMSRMQQLSVLLQVVDMTATNGGPAGLMPEVKLTGSLNQDVPNLLATVKEMMATMHAARYNALVWAVHVFEMKLKLLNEAMFQQSFWQPAATA